MWLTAAVLLNESNQITHIILKYAFHFLYIPLYTKLLYNDNLHKNPTYVPRVTCQYINNVMYAQLCSFDISHEVKIFLTCTSKLSITSQRFVSVILLLSSYLFKDIINTSRRTEKVTSYYIIISGLSTEITVCWTLKARRKMLIIILGFKLKMSSI